MAQVIGAGLFMLLIVPIFGKLTKLFPKVLIGAIAIIVGITLIPVGFNNVVNGSEGGAEPVAVL